MKVTRFHHVSVNCHDATLDDMVAFYGGLLGSPTCRGPTSPASPGTGTRSATSSCTSSARRRGARRSTPPATTTAWRSTTSTPPSPSSRRAGIEYQRGVQGESIVQIWINDPAGNTIELQQEIA